MLEEALCGTEFGLSVALASLLDHLAALRINLKRSDSVILFLGVEGLLRFDLFFDFQLMFLLVAQELFKRAWLGPG